MNRLVRRVTIVAALIVPLTSAPAAAAADRSAPALSTPVAATAAVSPALAADGSFIGDVGVSGTIDAGAWTLVSDLAAGEPPRFEPAGSTTRNNSTDEVDWSALGSNVAGDDGALNEGVWAVAVSGNDLYVGGEFTNAAGIPEADYVARWDGNAWSALGSNGAGNGALDWYVFAMAVSGSDLYVGGIFTVSTGTTTSAAVARWDGNTWSTLGDGLVLDKAVYALAISGDDVYVGGEFTNAAGIPEADYVAHWNGSSWSALGSNGTGNGALTNVVVALAVSGADVYAGGHFTHAAGIPEANFVARWNGSTWSALSPNADGGGAINGNVSALSAAGSDLYVGGQFFNAAGIPEADYVARWDGSAWSALGSNGAGNGALSDAVVELVVSGSDLYLSGGFTNAAGVQEADYVARWDGSALSALGSNGAGDGALESAPMGVGVSSDAVHVGGFFTDVAGIPTADYVASYAIPATVPSAPQSVTAVAGNAEATVSWSAPAFDGGSPISAYTVTASPGDQTCSWSSGPLSCTVTGLTNGTAYTFTVTATNAVGTGPASGPSSSVTPVTVPEAPVNVTAVAGNAEATVGWSAPAFDGGSPITAYTVTASPGGQTCSWSSGPLACAVTGLTNGTAYTFTVTATNAVGTGPSSAPSNSVTPSAPPNHQPDGRIKKGTSALIGNDIYSVDGASQTKTGQAARGKTIRFTISIQNDGDTTDTFTVAATGTAATKYSVKYFRGTANITSAVVAGSYQTTNLVPGAVIAITVKVKVLSGATRGSSVTRLVTLASVADGS